VKRYACPNLASQAADDPLFGNLRDLAEFKRLIAIVGPKR